jgi:hypothetical protein
MNYIERINDSRGRLPDGAVIPPDVFGFALSLKQPEALAQLPVPDALVERPLLTRQILMARTVGNQSVRLALDSYIASRQDSSVQYLGDMDPSSRGELLRTMPVSGGVEDELSVSLADSEVRRMLVSTKRAQLTGVDRFKSFLSYLDVRADSFPPDRWPKAPFGHNDVTLTQAFGRNTFADADLPVISAQHALYKDDTEMFSGFLTKEGFDAGNSNKALAEVVAAQLLDPTVNIEQVLQWEVAFALWHNYPKLYSDAQESIHVLWPKEGTRAYRTHEVKRDSVHVMEQNGLYNAYEFAHPDMMIRALKILGKLGIEADILAAKIPFDESSIQNQTRGEHRWEARELITRGEHLIRGRIRWF